MDKNYKTILVVSVLASIIISSLVGAMAGAWVVAAKDTKIAILDDFLDNFRQESAQNTNNSTKSLKVTVNSVEEESAVIAAVDKVSPAVVSIIVTKDLPIIERYYSDPGRSGFWSDLFGEDFGDFFGGAIPQYRQKGTEEREIGGGTGFILSSDGYIVTNKHVVFDEEAQYTVLMNDETKLEAEVLARDPINDLAIIKVDAKDLPSVEFGDSGNLKAGQTVIAIGNALGEFRNTVSTGVISGLARSVTAGGGGFGSEELTGVIQTDASINPGNSGGPLLNLSGQVIGINTAMAAGAENIGFAIPAADVISIYESVKQYGKIVRPWLGVRYVLLNESIAEANGLDIDYGALLVKGETQTDLAVIPGSPADKAGLEENDIILEIDGQKISSDMPLARIIAMHKPGDEVSLKILHDGDEKEIKLKLEERNKE